MKRNQNPFANMRAQICVKIGAYFLYSGRIFNNNTVLTHGNYISIEISCTIETISCNGDTLTVCVYMWVKNLFLFPKLIRTFVKCEQMHGISYAWARGNEFVTRNFFSLTAPFSCVLYLHLLHQFINSSPKGILKLCSEQRKKKYVCGFHYLFTRYLYLAFIQCKPSKFEIINMLIEQIFGHTHRECFDGFDEFVGYNVKILIYIKIQNEMSNAEK